MKRYILPCHCSRTIVVTAAQAGGAVRCAGCGADVAVPRLGALAQLEAEVGEPLGEPAREWTAGRSLLLAGAVVAVVAVATAGWLRGHRAGVAPLDEPQIRAAVAEASGDEVHASWLEFARQGIVRPPLREEQRRLRHAQALAALETVAWIAAAIGGTVTAAALIAGAASRRVGS